MANLTAVFELVDKISDKLDAIANKGSDAVDQFEAMGDAADQSFAGTTSAADGVVSAVSSYSQAATKAAAQTDFWTNAVGNYDKSALEATYSTEELVEMGMKSAEALEHEADIMEKCDRAAQELSDAIEQSSKLQDEYTSAMGKANRVSDEVADNDKVSAQAKERLQNATEEAAQAFDEMERAQNAAQFAMDNYDSVLSSGTASLEDMERAAEQAAKAADDLTAANERAADATSELSDATDNAAQEAENGGKSGKDAVEGIASALAAAGITVTVKEIATSVYEMAESFSEAEKIIAASSGATGQELEELKQTATTVFANTNAESVEDIAAGMSAVATATNLTGDALEEATEKGYQMQDLFGYEMSESARTASALMKNFGITASEAYDIITVGAQNGADKNGDLLDILNEYSVQYAALGLSADEFLQSLINGADAGVFSIDKVGDAVKEFNIRAKDGSGTTVEAFEALGMNADIMTEKFAAGGETASTAFFDVVNALESMEDPVQRNAAAVALFGTMYEDLEGSLLPILSNIENGTVDTTDALEKTAEGAESVGDKWTKAGNNIQTAFSNAMQPAIEGISGGLADVVDGIGDFMNEHPAITKGIAATATVLGVAAAAFAAYTVVQGIATAATALFGTTLSAAIWPITLVVAGVAAAIGVVTAFGSAFGESQEEVEDYNGTMEQCQNELEATERAYEKACEMYGENSDAAKELEEQLDTLNAQYEKGGGQLAVYAEQAQAVADSFDSISRAQEDAFSEIDNTETSALTAVAMLSAISEQSHITNADLDMMSQYADYLNNEFNCDIKVNYDTGELTGFDPQVLTDAIINAANDERYQSAIEYLSGAEFQDNYIAAKRGAAELGAELNSLYSELEAKTNINTGTNPEDAQNMRKTSEIEADIEAAEAALDDYNSTLAQAEAEMETYGLAIDKTGQFAENYKSTLDEMALSTEDVAQACEDSTENTVSYQEAATYALQSVQDELDALCLAYDEAYQAALESFQGQFGLFDMASTESEEYLNATVENAQKAKESQLAYWQEYNDNLETLTAYGESLTGDARADFELLLAYANDGSEQAAGLLDSMAEAISSGNEDAALELAETVGAVAEQQQEAAATTAEFRTNFNSEMEGIVSDMQGYMDDLGFTDEASKAASEAISSYVEGLRSGKNDAISAVEEVASAVESAFDKVEIKADVSYDLDTAEIDEYEMPKQTATAEYELESEQVDEYVPDDKEADAIYEVDSTDVDNWTPPNKTATVTYTTTTTTTTTTVPGHAGGTTDAEDIFIAGEEGPELIVGQQGSTVFPNSETERIIDAISGGSEAVTVMNEYEPTGFIGMLENAFSKLTDKMSALFERLGGITPTVELEGYASGTTSSDENFIAGEEGPELVLGKPDSTVFPADETDRIINAIGMSSISVGDAERNDGIFVPVGNDNGLIEDSGTEKDAATRKILLEIAGKGNIQLTGSKVDKDTLVQFLYEYLKPVLSEILTQEIYEEGDMAYEY